MTGRELVDKVIRAEMLDMEQIRKNCINLNIEQERIGKRAISRRVINIAVAVFIIAVISIPTALAYGDEIAAAIRDLFVVTPIAQHPANGYTNFANNSELLLVQHTFDGAGGTLEFHVSTYNLEESNGKYTLNEVTIGNAGLLLLKPKDSNGFFLNEGETIFLFAQLDLTPEYADEDGQTVQIGYSLDGVLHETFKGKLAGGGMTFEITAPSDGEFMIFVINACLELQNYTEVSVTLNSE